MSSNVAAKLHELIDSLTSDQQWVVLNLIKSLASDAGNMPIHVDMGDGIRTEYVKSDNIIDIKEG